MGGIGDPRVYARNKLLQLEESIGTNHATIIQSMLRIALQEALLLLTPAAGDAQTHPSEKLVLFLRAIGAMADFDYSLDVADKEGVTVSAELLCWYLVVVQNMVTNLHRSASTRDRIAQYHVAYVLNELLLDRVRNTMKSAWAAEPWAQDDFAELQRKGV